MLGMSSHFNIKNREITGTNGSLFLFEGLHQNVTKVKSLEGLDYVWIEEGENISEESWDILVPTIRKPNSEIIVTFNPARDDDPTYERFIINKRDDSWTLQVNYYDNHCRLTIMITLCLVNLSYQRWSIVRSRIILNISIYGKGSQ
jgi:phage terminase large subunit